MTSDMLSWLRHQIEHRKTLAEAATKSRRTGAPSNPQLLEDGGHWTYTDGDDCVKSAPPGQPSNYGVVGASCGCCTREAEGRPVDLAHIAANDPADTIARCAAELAELDAIEAIPHQRVIDDEWFSCSQARDEYGALSCYNDDRKGGPCDCGRDAFVDRMTRAKAYGYRHRSGYRPEWAPEGAAL